jgi:hypothetical protein
MHRPDDEHFSVPTWRMRQLQDIEDAARQCVELIRQTRPLLRAADDLASWNVLVVQVRDLLSEALDEDE